MIEWLGLVVWLLAFGIIGQVGSFPPLSFPLSVLFVYYFHFIFFWNLYIYISTHISFSVYFPCL